MDELMRLMDGWMDRYDGQISEYLNTCKKKKRKEKSIPKSIKYVLFTWKYNWNVPKQMNKLPQLHILMFTNTQHPF